MIKLKIAVFVVIAVVICCLYFQQKQAVKPVPNENKIELQTGTIDTRKPDKLTEKLDKNSPQKGLFLIQFKGVITEKDKAELIKAGAVLIGYIPQNSFLVLLEYKNISQVKGLSFVQWIGGYYPQNKIQKDLKLITKNGGTTKVTIMTIPNIDIKVFAGDLTNLGVNVLDSSINGHEGWITAEMKYEQIIRISEDYRVIWMEPHSEPGLSIN